jgi:putative ABC transport system permease protein
MLRVAIAGVMARKLRLLLTSFAVVLGVGFVASAFFLTDSMTGAFEEIFSETSERVDVEVQTTAYREFIEASSRGQGAFVGNDLNETGMSDADIEEIRGVDGVESAYGSIFEFGAQLLDEDGEPIGATTGAPAFAVGYNERAADLTGVEFVRGRAPQGAEQIAIDEVTARKNDLTTGDDVSIVAQGGREVRAFTIAGVATLPGIDSFGGATVSIFDEPTVQELLAAPGRYTIVDVKAESGVTPEELSDRVGEALGDDYLSQTASEYATQSTEDNEDGFISFFRTFILVFAGISVFVGAFTIFNTFSILVGQRTREFGMLRAIGASRRGVMGIVTIEAVVLGFVSSVIGIAAGYGIANLLRWVFNDVLDFGLPTSTMQLTGEILFWSFLVGVLVTLIASLVPAWRAARLAPLEALRLSAQARRGGWKSTVVGGIFVAAGVVLVALGLNPPDDASTTSIMVNVGGGAALVIVGVSMLARYMVGPVTRVLAPVFARGTTGRIAAGNVLRNRSRSAATAIALMIGLALATLVLVIYSSFNRTIDHEIDTSVGSDVLITNPLFSSGPPTVADEFVDAARETDGVADVFTVYSGASTVGDEYSQGDSRTIGSASEGALEEDGALTLDVVDGAGEASNNGVLLVEGFANEEDLELGDELELAFQDGTTRTFDVEGIYESNAFMTGISLLVSRDTFEATQPPAVQAASAVFITTDEDVSSKTVVKRIEESIGKQGAFLDVVDNEGLRDTAKESLRPLIGFIFAMLSLSLVIALFGIANTLALNVFERTREIGLLRAVGSTRRQLRRMIRIESVLVAVFGAIVGTVLGIAGGAALIQALESEGFLFALDPVLVVAVLVAGIVAGVFASILPARRAAKMDVLEAIATE